MTLFSLDSPMAHEQQFLADTTLCWKLLKAEAFAPVSGPLKNENFVSVAHGEPIFHLEPKRSSPQFSD